MADVSGHESTAGHASAAPARGERHTATARERRHARRVRAEAVAHSRWVPLGWWVAAVGLCIGGFAAGWRRSVSAEFYAVGVLAVAGMGHGLLAWVVRPRTRELLAAAARDAPARCPACGYALDGLKSDADGGRVCPECGGVCRRVRVF